jgi:hypothetical protein
MVERGVAGLCKIDLSYILSGKKSEKACHTKIWRSKRYCANLHRMHQ